MTEMSGSGRAAASAATGARTEIEARLVAAAAGAGCAVYVEGPPEAGQSQLAKATAAAARAGGMLVLAARGRELERDFPFGVAIQLFEEPWLATSPREQATLLAGPVRPAGELLSGAISVGGSSAAGLTSERAYAIIHGLFSLVRAFTAGGSADHPGRPLAMVVDEVHRADGPSLRFLAYLASRIETLPIALVLLAGADGTSADRAALDALRSASERLMLGPSATELPTGGGGPGASRYGPRTALARTALQKSLADGHRESVVDLAEVAWGDGALLESDEDAGGWAAVAGSMLFVDELERAVTVAQAARGLARAVDPRESARCHGWSLYHQGRVTAALAVAEAARAAQRGDPVARTLIAACRLAQGRLDEAQAALPALAATLQAEAYDAPMLLDVRAQIRLAQLRPADALADALEAGRLSRTATGHLGPGVVAWRSTAALARLALGQRARARALAEEELEVARERGITRVVVRDLRVLAFAAKGTRVLDLLGQAVRVGRSGPTRLEYVSALVDLGAATRRANQRTAARHPLRNGLHLAERDGVAALARRAREELDATGARSRRVILTGLRALTPSERRVADLAANGLTTRQIAQVLFVTTKTVEFHLRHVYQKLDIPSSRAELVRVVSSGDRG